MVQRSVSLGVQYSRRPVKFADLRAEVRRWGWARILFKGAMALLRKYAGLHLYRVNLRFLDRYPPAPILPEGIRVCLVPPEKLSESAEDPELEMDPEFVRAAIARGDLAFGVLKGERLVSYAWRTFSAAPDRDGLWVKVDPPYHYAYKAFTLPAYRGKRLHVAVSLLCDDYFRARGYAGEVGYNEVTNFPIAAAAKYLGRRRIGFAGYLKWFGRRIPFRTPALKKIGFEIFEPRQ